MLIITNKNFHINIQINLVVDSTRLTSNSYDMTELVAYELDRRAVHGMAGLDTILAGILMQKVVHVGEHGVLAGQVVLGALDAARNARVQAIGLLVEQTLVVAERVVRGVGVLVAAALRDRIGRQPLHVVVDPVDGRLRNVRLLGKYGRRRDERLQRVRVAARRAAQTSNRVEVRVVVSR